MITINYITNSYAKTIVVYSYEQAARIINKLQSMNAVYTAHFKDV